MAITLNESGGLGYYWYKSRRYKTTAVVGNCSPFGFGRFANDNPAANCQLCFQTAELNPESQIQNSIICQGPEWVKYVCAPPCTPNGGACCICCVGPNWVHEVRSPDVESERMFHMLWDTSEHGRWCRTGSAYCPDSKRDLVVKGTNIVTDADDEEIHVVGSAGNDISPAAICIRYAGGTPNPESEPVQHLREGDILAGATIEKIYHYSKWNNVEQDSQVGSVVGDYINDLNYHYVELSVPLTNQTYLANLANDVNPNVQIVAGGGIPNKCIVFGRFEFTQKRIYYSKLKVNPSLYTTTDDREVRDIYPVKQEVDTKKQKIKAGQRLKKIYSSQQSLFASLSPELAPYAGKMTEELDTEVSGFVNLRRNDTPDGKTNERYLKIYQDGGTYTNNSEGNEGLIEETIIRVGAADNSRLTGLTLTSPGAGYDNDVEVGIDSPTGVYASGVILGSAPLDSITVDTEGVGYQLVPAATITPNYTNWTANGAASLNAMVVSGVNVYQVIKQGTFGTTAPTHTADSAVNGTSKLKYRGNLPTFQLDLIGTTRTEYVELTKQGSGYTSTPSITFNTGTQTAVATMDGDRVIEITVTPGDDATSNPLITIGEAWVGTEPYSIGDQVFFGDNLYTAASNGTSGPTGPTHTTGTVSDGGVNWTYAGEAAKAVSKNYDGRITTVTILDAGGRSSEGVTFNVSLPTSPYVVGTQLQITPVSGDFTLDEAVLTEEGYGYTSSNTTITVPPVAGTTALATVEGIFEESDISTVSVGDQFRKRDDRSVAGIISEVRSGGTEFVSRSLEGTLQVGDILFLSNKKVFVEVTGVRQVRSVKTLGKIDQTLHESFTPQQVNTYDESQDRRLVDEFKLQNETQDRENTSFFGSSGSSAIINDLTRGNVSQSYIDQKLGESELQTQIDNVAARAFNENPDNSVRIFDVATRKVDKYGPIKRWRDLPRSTSEVKIMPIKWIPDERESIQRTFTITVTFNQPAGSCDFGEAPSFTQLPDVPTEIDDPENPGQTIPGSPFTPPLGCCQPCCPEQPNVPMVWSYNKYFVNNFSNAAARWSNIIRTYNDHPSNANWSYL
jgi:hypothetical protein